VIRAANICQELTLLVVLTGGVDELAASMAADIVEGSQLPVFAAYDDDAFAGYFDRLKTAGRHEVVLSCDTDPLTEKDPVTLSGKPRRFDIKIAM
jgi:hypothetical protein